MATVEKASDGEKGSKFPETLRTEIGKPVVCLALELKRGIKTKYGDRDALVVVERSAPDVEKTLWWPRKLAFPPMQTPFKLSNPAKGEYSLIVAEGSAEMNELWATGELAASVTAPAGTGSRAAEILKKFSKT